MLDGAGLGRGPNQGEGRGGQVGTSHGKVWGAPQARVGAGQGQWDPMWTKVSSCSPSCSILWPIPSHRRSPQGRHCSSALKSHTLAT